MNNISIAGTSEIQDYRLPYQGSLLNPTEVKFHTINEKKLST